MENQQFLLQVCGTSLQEILHQGEGKHNCVDIVPRLSHPKPEWLRKQHCSFGTANAESLGDDGTHQLLLPLHSLLLARLSDCLTANVIYQIGKSSFPFQL